MSDQEFVITVVSVILAGIALFTCTGFIYIKKGYIGIVERAGLYVGTFRSGLRYFAPLVDRRVGMYKLGPCRRLIEIDRRTSYLLDYEIRDYKLFHYSGHNLDGLVRLALSESPDDLSLSLSTRCQLVGVHFIGINKKEAMPLRK